MSSDIKWEFSELGKEAINASRPFSFKNREVVVFINTGDVLKGKFLHNNWSKVDQLPGQAKKALRSGDILLSEIRPANGRFAYVDFNADEFVVSTKFMVIQSIGQILPRFLYHILTCQNTLDEFQRIAESRSGTFPQITFDAIAHFQLPIPPKKQQIEIAEFLDEIQARLDLLQNTNTTLESIAQTIFKSWFIDFDPVRAKSEGLQPEGIDAETAALFPDSFEESKLGLIPKGWVVRAIGDVVKIVGGGTPSTKDPIFWSPEEYHWVTPKDLSNNASLVLLNTDRKISTRGLSKISSGLLPVDTLLMSSRAPIGYLAIAKIPTAINQGFIAITPHPELSPTFLLLWCQHNMEIIKQKANGSTFMEISKATFRTIPVIYPPINILKMFNKICAVLFEKITENERQYQTITSLRDTLLPRLISGQLQVPDELL